jgi:hypothetical protein
MGLTTTKRLIEFEYLRALAILVIVFGHCITSVSDDNRLPLFFENMVWGWTAIFVFISGYFFHYVFAQPFNYKTLVQKKIRLVAQPYLIILACSVFLELISSVIFYGYNPEPFIYNISGIWHKGFIYEAHWYVPFILLVYLLSPVYNQYILLNTTQQLVLFALLCMISAFMHRPLYNINILQSLLFFTPVYLAGILYSLHHSWFAKHTKALCLLAGFVFITSLYIQSFVFGHRGNYHKPAFEYAFLDFMFIQKIALAVLLVPMTQWFSSYFQPLKILKSISQMSFAIFFIHPVVLRIFVFLDGYTTVINMLPVQSSLLASFIVFFIVLFFTIAIIITLKKIIQRDTRPLIGY